MLLAALLGDGRVGRRGHRPSTSPRAGSDGAASELATAETLASGIRRAPASAQPAQVARRDVLVVGETLSDTYEIRALLGSGGMGQVYDALDVRLNRPVALKVSWPDLPGHTLRREAQVMAAFRHPGLVSVHAVASHRGTEYIVMERLLGLSLADELARRRPTGLYAVDEAIDVLLGVCEGLGVLHEAGLAHRDLTPSNVMLAPRGRVVLMDYGIARCERQAPDELGLTGTPLYMAPESAQRAVRPGQAHLVDIYALGIIAFEMLTGRPPFEAESPEAVLRKQVLSPPLRPSSLRDDVPRGLDDLVLDLCAKGPTDRPQATEDVTSALRAARSTSRASTRARRR